MSHKPHQDRAKKTRPAPGALRPYQYVDFEKFTHDITTLAIDLVVAPLAASAMMRILPLPPRSPDKRLPPPREPTPGKPTANRKAAPAPKSPPKSPPKSQLKLPPPPAGQERAAAPATAAAPVRPPGEAPPAARPEPPAEPPIVHEPAACPSAFFADVLDGALVRQLRAEAPAILAEARERLDAPDPLLRPISPACPLVCEAAVPGPAEDLWCIGDVHGDLLGLACAVRYCETQSQAAGKTPRFVLLGDLVDRGPASAEVILYALKNILLPGRGWLIAGNHDLALHREAGRFASEVRPAEWADALPPPDAIGPPPWPEAEVAELAIALFAASPRAIFFKDGLVASHGGFPLSDRWSALQGPSDLGTPGCLADFTWTRAHERARRKIPNRTTRGCEFGYEDLEGFCRVASEALGYPVRRLVRGHDHVEARYLAPAAYRHGPGTGLLTLNNMCVRLADEVFGPPVRTPCVGRYLPGSLPEVHPLAIPAEAVRQLYPDLAGQPEAA